MVQVSVQLSAFLTENLSNIFITSELNQGPLSARPPIADPNTYFHPFVLNSISGNLCVCRSPPRFTWVRTRLVGGLAGSPPSEPAEELQPRVARAGKEGRSWRGWCAGEAQLGPCPELPAQPRPPRALPALVRISVRAAHLTVRV